MEETDIVLVISAIVGLQVIFLWTIICYFYDCLDKRIQDIERSIMRTLSKDKESIDKIKEELKFIDKIQRKIIDEVNRFQWSTKGEKPLSNKWECNNE